jgi:hypothetical protein
MEQEREKELAQLLREYFSKETAAEILGTMPDLINNVYPDLEQNISGFALYPIGAVARHLHKDRDQTNALARLRLFADALAEKFPTSEAASK